MVGDHLDQIQEQDENSDEELGEFSTFLEREQRGLDDARTRKSSASRKKSVKATSKSAEFKEP
jgi:hypothetical protein